MRWLTPILLAGCMTDPNGDTCVWQPGSDGFCPSDSGGSEPKHTTWYDAGVGVVEGDLVRVALTRGETGERSHIETAVVAGVEPEHAAILLDGDPMPGTSMPQLAAIDDLVYLAWFDQHTSATVGAPLREGGTVIAEEIASFGTRYGQVRRVGDRFLFVSWKEQEAELHATWIDRDGHAGEPSLLASHVTSGFDISDDGASGAITIIYTTYDRTTMAHGLALARVAADGSHHETVVPSFDHDWITHLAVVGTSDGGALGLVELHRDGKEVSSRLRLAPSGTVRLQPSEVGSVIDLVRNGTTILAVSSAGDTRSQARVIDETGEVQSGPFVLDAYDVTAFASGSGFTLVHGSSEATVTVTPLDASGFPAQPVAIANTTVDDGCGCRSTNAETGGLFLVVGALVLRRRRVRRAA